MSAAKVLLFTPIRTLKTAFESISSKIPDCGLVRAAALDEAKSILGQEPIDVYVHHIERKEDLSDALRILSFIDECSLVLPTIIASDCLHESETTELVSRGVIECITLPINEKRVSNLLDVLTCRKRFLARSELPMKRSHVRSVQFAKSTTSFLFGAAEQSGAWMEQVRRIALTNATVILSGETGVGKTSMARLIHEASPRSAEPFVTVNCGALSPSLAESELLGHEKGAFTGAVRDHDGKMKAAGKGTLLLDEIDALPLAAQASLLRAVDERIFEAVGSNKSLHFESRLIVATNRDLKAEVQARRFREDLYYRINVASFHLPPLRERRELIPPLAEAFLLEFAARDNRTPLRLGSDAMTYLTAYDWPGNIRELKNSVERAYSFCVSNVISTADLPATVVQSSSIKENRNRSNVEAFSQLPKWLHAREDVERRVIADALSKTDNNRAKAARELGMSRVTLYKKLHKYELMRFLDGDPH